MSARDDNALPISRDAEQAVLGGIMLSPQAFTLVDDLLEDRDFADKSHQLLYRAIGDLARAGKPFDAVTMGEWLEGHSISELAGGTAYILQLANSTPSAANIAAYAEIVAEKSRLREVIDVGALMQRSACERGASAGLVVAEAIVKLNAMRQTSLAGGLTATKPIIDDWFADLHKRFESKTRVNGIATPWAELDDYTHGFQPGDLIIVAGRPNMGKSIFGLNTGVYASQRFGHVAVFSLEMSKASCIRRSVAALGNVPHEWLMAPTSDHCEAETFWGRVTAATTHLRAAKLQIDDTGALTVGQICARARRAHLRTPLSMVVVDHLQIVKTAGKDRNKEIGEITAALKALGKDLGCPVIALSQLNRGVHGRDDKRPVMADLRESGAIEQDADVILFLHREDYYDRGTHLLNVVEVEIGKGRDIKTGTRVYLENRYDCMRLDPWIGPLPEPPKREPKASTSGVRSKRTGNPGADLLGGQER